MGYSIYVPEMVRQARNMAISGRPADDLVYMVMSHFCTFCDVVHHQGILGRTDLGGNG